MKTILSSRRHHHVAIVSIFLVAIALIAGMAGCGTTPVQYELTITSNSGGLVTEPGEGVFTYDEGTVVNLVATADAGYDFGRWTAYGNVATLADWGNTTTTITMNDDYTIRAGFGLEIRDWYDLDAIGNNLSSIYVLVNDLDSTTPGYEELASPTANEGKGWKPIGSTSHAPFIEFSGTFYGKGYEIRNLFINRLDEEYVGLFSNLRSWAIIFDIGVVNANVTGKDNVGSLVGYNGGYVLDSYSTGNVIGTGEGGIGGLVGQNGGTISRSCFSGSVTGNLSVGGLVGSSIGTVYNSYSTGSVTGHYSVGGLVGDLAGYIDDGTVGNSYANGKVTGDDYIGGLVGASWGGSVSNSFWDIETSGQATSAGGTGKTTTEMKDIDTFSNAAWNIIAVNSISERNPAYIWNMVDYETYPFFSWQT